MLSSLPYSRGLILDNTHNYGIMKTETVFGFRPSTQENYENNSLNATDPIQWIITDSNFQKRSLQENQHKALNEDPKKVFKSNKKARPKGKKANKNGKKKNKKRKSKKINKCVIKFMNDGQGQEESTEYKGKKRRRKGSKVQQMQKKYMMPVILGLLAAKSILIPIALKALAFMSAKGLMMGFFSTVLASVISLKGMFNHPQEPSRKDDAKTQVEIIQVPTKSEDHVYYDEHYKRGDFIPVFANPEDFQRLEDNNIMLNRKSSKGK